MDDALSKANATRYSREIMELTAALANLRTLTGVDRSPNAKLLNPVAAAILARLNVLLDLDAS